MQENNPPAPNASSAFEIVTPSKSKKSSPKNIIIILLVFVFLAGAVFLGVTLVQQNQNVAEKAAGNCDNPSSIVQCPRSDGALVSCNPPDVNNNAQISLCNSVGRIEACGGVQYCCPAVGGSWTTNMAACETASPTPTATPSATPTATPTETIAPLVTQVATATPTTTATATATPKASSTPIPVPVTGEAWPTYLGAGVGVVVIIASIFLAI